MNDALINLYHVMQPCTMNIIPDILSFRYPVSPDKEDFDLVKE